MSRLCAQAPPLAYPGSMEHVWQSLQMEEGAGARNANDGLQDGRPDALTNGAHPATQTREKCWIHRVRFMRVDIASGTDPTWSLFPPRSWGSKGRVLAPSKEHCMVQNTTF